MLVRYECEGGVATLTMDDGKVNVMSLPMQTALHQALDRAAAEAGAVVIGGRPGVFSAGFDLTVLRAGGDEARAMVRGGFELAHRVLSFPRPVVVACSGHAIAMGAFLLLSGDYVVGADGPYKLTANEVALGLTMPAAALAILRQRLTPAAFTRTVVLAEAFAPAAAVSAGFLDRLVDSAELAAAAREVASAASTLDSGAHASSKLRARGPALSALRDAIDADEIVAPAGSIG